MIVELGSGTNPQSDSDICIDMHDYPSTDIVADLNEGIPLSDNFADTIYAYHVLEHLDKIPPVMKEIHRVLKPNGSLIGEVPHYTDKSAFTDPTHQQYFTTNSFDYWDSSTSYGSWNYFNYKFSIKYCKRKFRYRFWLSRPIEFELRAIK